MFVILPDEVDGLDELIRNFEKVTLQKLYSGEMWAVELLLPKFKVETKLDLESALGKVSDSTRISFIEKEFKQIIKKKIN